MGVKIFHDRLEYYKTWMCVKQEQVGVGLIIGRAWLSLIISHKNRTTTSSDYFVDAGD